MADGKWVPIESIKIGSVVLSYNPSTSKLYPNVVVARFNYSSNTIYVINGNLSTDAYESFYAMRNGSYSWVRASQLKIGDQIYDPLTGSDIIVESIKISHYNISIPVYDIIGSEGNNFIVSGGYLVDKVSP
jgi:hypothetical protein